MENNNSVKTGEWKATCPNCHESLVIQELPIALTCPFCNSLFALKEDNNGNIVTDKNGLEKAKLEIEEQREFEEMEKLKNNISLLLEDGQKKGTIKRELIRAGVDTDTAHQLVDEVDDELQKFKESPEGRIITSEKYKGHMIFGAVLFFAGAILSLALFSSATSGRGGGAYIIFTGAIGVGIAEFFRGLFRWRRYKNKIKKQDSD